MIQHKRKRAKAELYSVDALMTKLSLSLVRSFQEVSGDPCFAGNLQAELRRGDVPGIRRETTALTDDGTPYQFKMAHQLRSILKRHRYQNDIYSDSELQQEAINSFLQTQSRIANVDLDSLSASDQIILNLAARYVSEVLGPYSDEEHRSLCRFGSGATVGIPVRAASLAARWELPISGSQNQIHWFDSEMSQVDCISKYWSNQQKSAERPFYREVDSLALVLVPKTFKSLRVIMPNTTIGSYMSYGLGEMIRNRLKSAGYNISDLQQRHRYYAQQGSIHGLWTTADLSSASDSITDALVRRLFPKDWYDILSYSRIGSVRMPDGSVVQSNTFCTMGIGYTFPLQTLVFLSLLKAIEHFHYGRLNRRLISVYGDDMIYSSRMHEQVVSFFSKVGFIVNLDKTYCEGNFRESCGGDYYHGMDVRPFQPRNSQAKVGRKAYEAILYKCINGLLMRWSEYEIGPALNFLTAEIEKIVGVCKIVPQDFPDEAGIKSSLPCTFEFLKVAKTAKPKSLGHGRYRFSFLRFMPSERKETRHDPYLWEALQDRTPINSDYWRADLKAPPSAIARQIEAIVGVKEISSSLFWREAEGPNRSVRSKITGRRLRRLESRVTISHSGSYTRQSGVSCFEHRR